MRKLKVLLLAGLLLCFNVSIITSAELGAGAGSGYPGVLDTDAVPETGLTIARADVPNDLGDAIVNIQTELGTDPAGTMADVKTRLAVSLENNGVLKANSVDSDQYVDGSIDKIHLAPDCIDETKIEDDGVDSEHYNDGSIDRIHLEADIIDETRLEDNSVDSEHYNDGSIDTEHLANDAVDDTKIDWGVGANQIIATKAFVGARGWKTGAQDNIDGNVWVEVTLDAETYDLGGDFDIAASSFTAPVNGYYQVNAVITMGDIVADKRYLIAIYKNGASITSAMSHASLAISLSVVVSDTIYLATNDYLELFVHAAVGGGASTGDIANDETQTFMTVFLLAVP